MRSGSAQAAGPFPSPLAAPILAGMAGGYTSRVFIGRAEELRRLAAALDRAEQERPQLVLVAGDAGMGKTRLLLEFAGRARQRGSRVLVGGCVELATSALPICRWWTRFGVLQTILRKRTWWRRSP
jgi:Cdc6-like AAA superfamily ATPase